MKPIKEVIEEKYSKEYFQKMGRKWWDNLTPEEQVKRKEKLKEASKRGGEVTKNKYNKYNK